MRGEVSNLYPNIFIIPFAFLCGYLFFRPIQRDDQEAHEKRFLEKMKETLVPEMEERIVKQMQVSASFQEMGIIAVKPRLNYEELRDRISQSKGRVYLSDTGFFHKVHEFEEAFHQAALHQVPLRILLLDPKSAMAKQRILDIFQQKADQENISRTSIANLATFYKKLGLENMELRLHSTMPAMQIFICDNVATIGFYFYGKDSHVQTQLDVLIKDEKAEYTAFGKQIETEFENRWNQATPIPL